MAYINSRLKLFEPNPDDFRCPAYENVLRIYDLGYLRAQVVEIEADEQMGSLLP
jgi:hypothetical protein